MQKLVTQLYKCRPMPEQAGRALVLYDVGGSWVAIGEDADRLYLSLGWEITDFTEDGIIYSYMLVSTRGTKVLQTMGIDFEIIKLSVSQDIDKASLALTQQTLDYLRLQVGTHAITYPFVCHRTTVESVGYIREIRLTSLGISRESVVLCIDNSEQIELVHNHEWNFGHISLTLLRYISSIIEEQFDYLVSYLQTPRQAIKEQKLQNTAIYKQYLVAKEQLPPETLPLLKVHNVYLTFDDDAITVASLHRHILLYECKVIGLRGRTVAMLEESQLHTIQQKAALPVIDSHFTHLIYQIGLTESYLNQKCDMRIIYTDVAIRKCKGGAYAITASYNGNQLNEKYISTALGAYYCSLPECKERSAILFSLVHQSYDKTIAGAMG